MLNLRKKKYIIEEIGNRKIRNAECGNLNSTIMSQDSQI